MHGALRVYFPHCLSCRVFAHITLPCLFTDAVVHAVILLLTVFPNLFTHQSATWTPAHLLLEVPRARLHSHL